MSKENYYRRYRKSEYAHNKIKEVKYETCKDLHVMPVSKTNQLNLNAEPFIPKKYKFKKDESVSSKNIIEVKGENGKIYRLNLNAEPFIPRKFKC